MARELNFDGLVGPTHNYSGLSPGNLASAKHKDLVSNPKKAALQGLEKMKLLHDLGIPQAVLPPQERPHTPTLKRLGNPPPPLFYRCCSASSMWAANIATATPSIDSGNVHITPANLVSMLHRSIEPPQTYRLFKKIFPKFILHEPLPQSAQLSDEGAANHTRLCKEYGEPGLHLFTYGGKGTRYPARQTRRASETIARLHKLKHVLFLEQNPEAIDAGVFHNDVIAVGDRNLLFLHEKAYVNQREELKRIRDDFARVCNAELDVIEISEISLEEAVRTYIFNSQIVGDRQVIAPIECKGMGILERIGKVHYIDVRESMWNGGGPACLRLRLVLTDEELSSVHPGVILTEALYAKLIEWVERHYRDELKPEDLLDPELLTQSNEALDELTRILNLGDLYDFQKRS